MNKLVWPKISAIDSDNMKVWLDNNDAGALGGFDWNMDFKWIDVNWYEKGIGKPTPMWDPKPTPTIIGAVHAMSKKFFMHLGMYDPDFDIWGGEDVE
jgi:polypeptide N-acetylgalactosaminyltransferase